jgi:hypothetical protein
MIPAAIPGKFLFQHQYIDRDLDGDSFGQAAAADVDGDGIAEYIFGERGKNIYWYDYDRVSASWTRYLLGVDSPSDVGGTVLDVDGDGFIDFVAGGAWYRHSRDPRHTPFTRFVFDPDLHYVHDVVVADLDGDGKMEVITMSDQNNVRYYKIPDDPTQLWERHDIGPSVHAGISVGDIDGDGDLDVVRSNVWFENVQGDASIWVEHPLGYMFGGTAIPWQENATYSWVADIDRDGDNDIVITDAEIVGALVYWMENVNGDGSKWIRHLLPPGDSRPRGPFHSLYVGDLDGDGDEDIFTCEAEDIVVPGDPQPRWYIWENIDGKGGEWREHVILDAGLGGHDAMVADFDGDGDLDICAKLWCARADNANNGRMHVDFLENISKH